MAESKTGDKGARNMLHNYYHTQKMAETHRYGLMREAEQQRLLTELPHQQNFIAAKLGTFFSMLGASLKQFGRTATQKPAPTTAPLSLGSPRH